MMMYALQWTDIHTDETTLCEVEAHVVYVCGTKLQMERFAKLYNHDAIAARWPSRYRAVPLPFTGDEVPTWAEEDR